MSQYLPELDTYDYQGLMLPHNIKQQLPHEKAWYELQVTDEGIGHWLYLPKRSKLTPTRSFYLHL